MGGSGGGGGRGTDTTHTHTHTQTTHTTHTQHCADRTKEFQFESLGRFVDNVARYMAGRELLAVCDKRAGY